ncbi:hypothetical protein D0868_04655, partial [Hortaea werneckii]
MYTGGTLLRPYPKSCTPSTTSWSPARFFIWAFPTLRPGSSPRPTSMRGITVSANSQS